MELAEPEKLGVLPAVDPELASSRPVTETAGIVRPTAAIQQTTSIASRMRLPPVRLGSKLRCLVSPPGDRTSRLIVPPKRCLPDLLLRPAILTLTKTRTTADRVTLAPILSRRWDLVG